MGWLTRFIVIALFAMFGCASYHPVPLTELVADSDKDIHDPEGQKIRGYATVDGAHHDFRGWVRLDGPDSVSFSAFPFEMEGQDPEAPPRPQVRFMLARSDVATLDVK